MTPLAFAVALVVSLPLSCIPVYAGPTSIDFDSNNAVESGEPTHYVGMTLPGQEGAWYKLDTGNGSAPDSPTIATPEGTFTFNKNGADYRKWSYAGLSGSVLRLPQ